MSDRQVEQPAGVSASLSADVLEGLSKRLSALALIYSGAYLAAYGTGAVRSFSEEGAGPPLVQNLIAGLSILLGLVVYSMSRKKKLPVAKFYDLVLAFQVLGAIGITASAWGWEHQFDVYQHHIWEALGPPGSFPEDFVARMQAAGSRLVEGGGVPWSAVWLLIYSPVLPMSPRRTLLGAVLTAAVVPAALYLSTVVNGTPASVRPWVASAALDVSIPMFICAAISYFGSQVVYKLTRDLSRARQMGSYRLVERIGMGGMGEVWRAKHRMLARPAAVKLIHPTMLGGQDVSKVREVVRRFEREAQATAMLGSPHTVDLYDFGVTQDGTFYYVMELLEGLDLRTLVTTFGIVPPERAIFLLRQVCHSLEDAHRSGLVHRDIKPANVFACRRGIDCDFVKVLDFGLVKETFEVAGDTMDVTLDGVARGTPAFMAPEIATGVAPIDGRADLYSLGCVAYWLVTGQVVFEAPNAVATLLRQVRDEPVAPSLRRGSPLPPRFEAAIMDCLHKEAARRPQSAAELEAQLAACERDVDPWTSERADAWWRDHADAIAATHRHEDAGVPGRPALVGPAVRSSGGARAQA